MSKGVALLSGGLDSAVTAYVAWEECGDLYALTFDYGQVHKREIVCALSLGERLGVKEHKVLELPLDEIGGSSLFSGEEIPNAIMEGIPSTWVPQRNAVFLALGFGWAEVLGCDKVYIGVNVVDYSGYPDCRPEFVKAMQKALELASKQFVETGSGIDIVTPIIHLSKKNIVELGLKLGVPFRDTTSCYRGEEEACGECPSCLIRLKAFSDLGMEDPIKYKGVQDERT